jgi:ketosteroid isomerase-like protein
MENQRKCLEDVSAADTLIAYEHETWSLIQRKDLNGFASYLAEDFYDIFPDGQERTKSELLEFLHGADLKDHRLSNFRVTMLTHDAAIVTYHVDARAIINGKEMLMNNSVTSGWAKRGGRWVSVSAVASARLPQDSQ